VAASAVPRENLCGRLLSEPVRFCDRLQQALARGSARPKARARLVEPAAPPTPRSSPPDRQRPAPCWCPLAANPEVGNQQSIGTLAGCRCTQAVGGRLRASAGQTCPSNSIAQLAQPGQKEASGRCGSKRCRMQRTISAREPAPTGPLLGAPRPSQREALDSDSTKALGRFSGGALTS